MRYKVINKIQAGDVLGRTLIDNKGNILVKSGNTLTEKMLNRIKDFNYGGLYIDDEISKDIQIEDLIPFDLKLKTFKALQAGNYELCVSLAKQFVSELINKDSLAINIIDIKNTENYTLNHSIQVCIDSIILGISYGLDERELDNLAVAALLADIGKKEIPLEILHKTDKLTEEEMKIMQQHPKIAFEKLKVYPCISPISRNAILFSHENLDGSGYYQRKDKDITIYSKIIHCADTFDALTSVRRYRPAFSIKEASELLMGSSNRFDMKLLSLVSQLFPIYPIGLTVKLSNNESAVIVTNEHNNIRPIIRVIETNNLIDLSDNINYRNVVIQDIDR